MTSMLISLGMGILGEIAKRTILKPEKIVDILGKFLDQLVEGTDTTKDDVLKGLLDRNK